MDQKLGRRFLGRIPDPRDSLSPFREDRPGHYTVNQEEVSGHRTAVCTQVPGLLQQANNQVAFVTADGAYDAGAVCDAGR
jgi:hypothetical protein